MTTRPEPPPAWMQSAGWMSLTLGGLGFLGSAVVGGEGGFGAGVLSGLLNPLFFIGVPLGLYWVGRGSGGPDPAAPTQRPSTAPVAHQRPSSVEPEPGESFHAGDVYEDRECFYFGHDPRLQPIGSIEGWGGRRAAFSVSEAGIELATPHEAVFYPAGTVRYILAPRGEWVANDDTGTYRRDYHQDMRWDELQMDVTDPEGISRSRFRIRMRFRNDYFTQLMLKKIVEGMGLKQPPKRPPPPPKPVPVENSPEFGTWVVLGMIAVFVVVFMAFIVGNLPHSTTEPRSTTEPGHASGDEFRGDESLSPTAPSAPQPAPEMPERFWSIGDIKQSVRDIEGEPVSILNEEFREIWFYGDSARILFDSVDQRVIAWNNLAGRFNVRVILSDDTIEQASGAVFHRGSTREQVLRAQGTPDAAVLGGDKKEEMWFYNRSRDYVVFYLASDRVVDWRNGSGNLNAR